MNNKVTTNITLLISSDFIIDKKIILFLFFMSLQWLNSQNLQLYFIPDSLKAKSYEELLKGFNDNYNDTIKERIYTKAYLNKAKNENDSINIATAYSLIASITTSDIALSYADSIINITKNSNHFKFPAYGFIIKGMLLYNFGDYEASLVEYLNAYNYATNNNNTEQLLIIKYGIGSIKNLWGNYTESLESFKSLLKLLQLEEGTNLKHHFLYLPLINSLGNSYLLNNKLDSAMIFAKMGISTSLEFKDTIQYYNFLSQTGIIAYYQNNFDMALDSLNKGAHFSILQNDIFNDYYYKGQIFRKQKKEAKAFFNFKKADSIYNITNDVVPEVRNIQEFFVDYYRSNNDIENQLIYIDRLIYVDSIIATNYKHLNETLFKKYDTQILISNKEKIIADLKREKQNSSIIILGLILFTLSVMIFFIYYYRKQRILKERFKKVLLNSEKSNHQKDSLKTQTKEIKGISKEIVKSILIALEKFENNNIFLENGITLNSLSKRFNTNSNYLSKIINTYKEKNFSTYISDLRIEYCIEKLKKDPTFRKYSIEAIAFEIGFNNSESFSKAFFKKTEIYPSYYIKELEKRFKN
jgi:AraC-like DNA-binding protein